MKIKDLCQFLNVSHKRLYKSLDPLLEYNFLRRKNQRVIMDNFHRSKLKHFIDYSVLVYNYNANCNRPYKSKFL